MKYLQSIPWELLVLLLISSSLVLLSFSLGVRTILRTLRATNKTSLYSKGQLMSIGTWKSPLPTNDSQKKPVLITPALGVVVK